MSDKPGGGGIWYDNESYNLIMNLIMKHIKKNRVAKNIFNGEIQ